MNNSDATRAKYALLIAFRSAKLYWVFIDGKPNLYEIAKTNQTDLLRLKGIGPKTLLVIGKALENLDVIPNGEEWAKIKGAKKDYNVSLRSLNKKLDRILDILTPERKPDK